MFAPLVVFVYNRPEHAKITLDTLNNSPLANKTDLFIFSDHPKKEIDIPKVELTRKYIDQLKKDCNFKSVNISKSTINKGLANSVIHGVTDVITKYGKVIVVEDDLLTSEDFLGYMNKALDFYKNKNEVWSISGYTFPMESLKKYKKDIYFGYRASSWGWATWLDRWNSVDWKVSDYESFKFNLRARSKLNRGGYDMADMLDRQMRGEIDSWAIRWCYQQSKLNKLTVFPKVSRVKNIGTDGSGTHSKATSKFDTFLYKGLSECKFEDIIIDKAILKEFQKKFKSNIFVRTKMGIKSLILRLLF